MKMENRDKPLHILLFRFSAMGDVAMTAAALHEFAAAHPQHRFTMVSRPMFAPLFDGVENISFVEADFKGSYKGLRGLLKLFYELRQLQPDVVADLHDVLRTQVLRSLFFFFGVPVKKLHKDRYKKWQLTRRRCKKLHPLKTMLERYTEVLEKAVKGKLAARKIQVEDKKTLHSPLSTFNASLSSSPVTRHPSLITRHSSPVTKIGIAPFAKHKEKIYPPQRTEKIIAHFAQMENVEIYLFGGGKTEIGQLNAWEAKYPSVTSVAGKLPFSEELFHLSSMNVVLSMDSANMHLSSFMCVPVVSVWGATHPYAGFTGWHQPADNNVQIDLSCRPCSVFGDKPCYRKDNACMNIPEELIIEKIMNILKENN